MQDVPFQLIAFDADDTLWVNEPLYRGAEDHLVDLLSPYLNGTDIRARLYDREVHNLNIFGYGAKAFILSMIETAVELTKGSISGGDVQRIVDSGKEMLAQPIKVLPGVEETLRALSGQFRLMVITKGDLFDQESKLARSGLAGYFSHVEIVSEKNEATYSAILGRYKVDPDRFIMFGNSLRSDILPIVNIGGHAAHIPCDTTWQHEHVDDVDAARGGYHELRHIGAVPEFLARWK